MIERGGVTSIMELGKVAERQSIRLFQPIPKIMGTPVVP